MNRQRGITLIALVITIIVLLILAGVSISLVVGENGILDQATTSVESNKRVKEKEQISLAYAALQTGVLTGKKISVTAAELEALINNTEGEGTVVVTENKSAGTLTIIYKESKIGYTIDNNGEFIGEKKIEVVQPTNVSDWIYTVNKEENTIAITAYEGSDKEIVVPNYIGEIPVKNIIGDLRPTMCGNYPQGIWGYNICERIKLICSEFYCVQNDITKVTISEGIENIGECSFAYGHAVKEVTIPSSVTSIGDSAFSNCSSLTTVNYTGTEDEWERLVTSIGDYNSYLTSATINYNYAK